MAIYLGLISGTSMDAIDAALVDFEAAPLCIIATRATPFEPDLKRRISALIDQADHVALDEVGQIDVELGSAFAQAALALMQTAGISADRVTAIGSHGQTLRHRPDLRVPFTWQIGDPNTLAEMTGVSVVADFRRRDVAAGGQGAPLLPVFHDQVFRSDAEDRVNDSSVTGFDTGPANRLLDAWIARHVGKDFDAGGAWARSGLCRGGCLRMVCQAHARRPGLERRQRDRRPGRAHLGRRVSLRVKP
jgi:anhydro-N-acetylmuramic acid kinase